MSPRYVEISPDDLDPAPNTGAPSTNDDYSSRLSALINGGASRKSVEDFIAQSGGSVADTQGLDQAIQYKQRGGKGLVQVQLDAPQSQAYQEIDPSQLDRPDGGRLRAAVNGAGDVLTSGLLDEGVAALGAIDPTHDGSMWDGRGFGEAYNQQLNHARDIIAGDEQNHPNYRLAGQLVGGLALPVSEAGGLGRLAAEGAAYGAAYGAGSADGGITDRLTGAATGAAGGAVLGAGLGAATRAVSNAASRLGGSATARADMRQLADRLDIAPTPATVGGGITETLQRGLGNLPGGETAVAAGVNRETSGLQAAARRTADDVGTVGTPQSAGEELGQGASDYRATSRTEANSLYGERDALFGGQSAPVQLDNAAQAYQDIASKFPTSPAIAQLNEHPVLRRLLDPATSGEPLTLGEATEALSHIRGVKRNLEAKKDASGPVLARVGKIEQAIEDDVTQAGVNADLAAGRTPGEPGSAVAAQKDADAFYADRASALNGSLKTSLLSAKDATLQSGESVYRQVTKDMDKKGGNLARLQDTWKRLPETAKSTFAATRIDDMGRAVNSAQDDLGNVWSFNTFLTNYNNQSPEARKIVFGDGASEQLADIAKYASRLRDIDKSRNFSNTARNVLAGAYLTTVGGALWNGDTSTAGKTAIGIPATLLTGKVFMASPAMRKWTADALSATIGSMAGSASANATLRQLPLKLKGIAATNPVIANDVGALFTTLRHAIASPVAASEPTPAPAHPITTFTISEPQQMDAPTPEDQASGIDAATIARGRSLINEAHARRGIR